MRRKRMSPPLRKEEILQAALSVAEDKGYSHITRDDVAAKAKCAESTITFYYGTMRKLRRSVLKHAIKHEKLKIIAQGLVNKDALAIKLNEEIKTQALNTLL